MAKRWGIEGLRGCSRKIIAALALWVVLGCGDGVVGAAGGSGDTGTVADLVAPEDTLPEDTLPEDTLPDTAPDTLPDTLPDTEDTVEIVGVDTLDTDTEPETCWSCTTEDPACLCGCVVCHTDKPRLQELAPDEPPDEEEGGGG